MFTLATNQKIHQKHLKMTIFTYFAVAIFTILLHQIYGLFGHGVQSAAMTWMFLYPLIGGGGVFLLIKRIAPNIPYCGSYRVFCNLHHAGIAALTASSFLKGILEIAGTTSPYATAIYAAGWLLLAAGVAYYWRKKTLKH